MIAIYYTSYEISEIDKDKLSITIFYDKIESYSLWLYNSLNTYIRRFSSISVVHCMITLTRFSYITYKLAYLLYECLIIARQLLSLTYDELLSKYYKT